MLNPGFDGSVAPTIEDGAVTGLMFGTDHVTDLSPVRADSPAEALARGSRWEKGRLVDLRTLRGMPLSVALLDSNILSDLTPLEGMPLQELSLWQWTGSDLTPLKGMPLKILNIGGSGDRARSRNSPGCRWKI